MKSAYKKYADGVGNDLAMTWALRALSAAVNGYAGRMTFKMVTDDQMRALLDDEDYSLWIEKANEFKETSAVGEMA